MSDDTAAVKWSEYLLKLARSFPYFQSEIMRLQWGFKLHWLQWDMCDWLQNGPHRRGIIGMRGFSKTDCATGYTVWLHFKDVILRPDHLSHERVLYLSKSQPHAEECIRQCRQWLEDKPFLNILQPHDHDSLHRDSARRFDVGPTEIIKTPSIRAQGITSQLEGGRATLAISDDIETKENTLTRDQRLLLAKRFEEVEYILEGSFNSVVLGTVKHPETIYRELSNRGYQFRSYPVRVPRDNEATPWLAPCISDAVARGELKPGDPVWPERWDKDGIVEMETRAKTTFAMEMMGRIDLSAEERHPLKLRNVIVHPCRAPRDKAPTEIAWGQQDSHGSTRIEEIPSLGFGTDGYFRPVYVGSTYLPYSGCKAYIDPAGGGSDEFTWAIVAHLYGNLYLKHVGAFKESATNERLLQLVESLREHNVRDARVETNFGGDSYLLLLEPLIRKLSLKPGKEATEKGYPDGWTCTLDGEFRTRKTGFKEMFICDVLEPVFNAHRLVMDPAVARDQTLAYQIVNIMRERRCLDHDDRIDAVAGAVDMWKDVLDLDSDTLNARREEQSREDAVAAYIESLHGYAPVRGPIWGRPHRAWAN